MSEWKEYKLGDFLKVKHGYAFKGENIVTEETPNILVTPGNFNIGGGFKSDKFKYYKGDEFPKEYILTSGDIVVTMTDLSKDSDTLGYSAKIPYSTNHNYLHNQRIGLVQFVNENVCKDFVYWLMRTREYQNYIVGSASGTSIMHTSPSRIEDYRCLIPSSLSEQERIASILSSLDDKIDLLHRENKTLEAMAETLFRQWFVEEAKEDWKENSLGKCIKLVGGGTPKTSEERFWNGNVFWLSGGDIANNHKSFVSSSEKSISEDGLNNSSAKLLPENTMVISARGTVGKYCLLSKPMAFSQSNYGILPIYNDCYFFTYLLVAYHIDELQSAAYGSVFDTITTKTFEGVSVLIPKETSYIVEFEKMIEPYFSKMKQNNKQIQTLIQQRDSLLPKLMSGEVKI
jgi:type I restriction enzyme S subunit